MSQVQRDTFETDFTYKEYCHLLVPYLNPYYNKVNKARYSNKLLTNRQHYFILFIAMALQVQYTRVQKCLHFSYSKIKVSNSFDLLMELSKCRFCLLLPSNFRGLVKKVEVLRSVHESSQQSCEV